MPKYRYLGPEWIQSPKNQIDLEKQILTAPAQPSAPAEKTKYSFKRNKKFVQVENFVKINKRVGT